MMLACRPGAHALFSARLRASIVRFGVFVLAAQIGIFTEQVDGARMTGLERSLRREESILRALERWTTAFSAREIQIARSRHRVRVSAERIDETKRRIASLKTRLEKTGRAIKGRLRALYKLGRGRYARMLLRAQAGGADLAVESAAIGRIVARDIRELRVYREEMARLTQLRATLREQKRTAEIALDALNSDSSRLDRERKAYFSRLDTLRRHRPSWDRVRTEFSAAERTLSTRIRRLKRRIRRAGGLSGQRGRLPWPVKGRLVGRFGQPIAAMGKRAMIRSGLTLVTRGPALVRALYSGEVRIAGRVPGYGELVVIEHAGGYYSVYGFLREIRVKPGEKTKAGAPLGRTAIDPLLAQSALYFELRRDQEALNPLRWLRAS